MSSFYRFNPLHPAAFMFPSEDAERERIERTTELNQPRLTREQEQHLHRDYSHPPDSNGIDSRRIYSGPRWPWLCGPPRKPADDTAATEADQDPLLPESVRRMDGAVPTVPLALRPGLLDTGTGPGVPAPKDP